LSSRRRSRPAISESWLQRPLNKSHKQHGQSVTELFAHWTIRVDRKHGKAIQLLPGRRKLLRLVLIERPLIAASVPDTAMNHFGWGEERDHQVLGKPIPDLGGVHEPGADIDHVMPARVTCNKVIDCVDANTQESVVALEFLPKVIRFLRGVDDATGAAEITGEDIQATESAFRDGRLGDV
jgi:hypothetical protein